MLGCLGCYRLCHLKVQLFCLKPSNCGISLVLPSIMFLIGLSNFIIFLYLYLNWVHMFIALVKEEMEFAVHFFFLSQYLGLHYYFFTQTQLWRKFCKYYFNSFVNSNHLHSRVLVFSLISLILNWNILKHIVDIIQERKIYMKAVTLKSKGWLMGSGVCICLTLYLDYSKSNLFTPISWHIF